MGENTDLMTTETGKWSATRIKYTFTLIKYLKPENKLEKAVRYFRNRYSEPLSETQWKKIIGAKGPTGEQYFDDLVTLDIMVPEGTENSNNRHYDVYSVDRSQLTSVVGNSKVTENILNGFIYLINQEVDGRKVIKDF